MQPLSQLETCLRLAYEARDAACPSGVSISSYFVRAPTRGRRRADLEEDLLFPQALKSRLPETSIAVAMDPSSYRTCDAPTASLPDATREWLAQAALQLGNAEGFPLMWALLRAQSELEQAAQRLLGARASRSVVRQVLHGVSPRTLRVEPFAALLVRVLKISQAVYAAFRHAGSSHAQAWEAVHDRLWSPHPTGRRGASGAEARGAYLPSLVHAASGNARRKLKKSAEEGRTQDHARALLARFAAGPGASLWPWLDAAGAPLPAPLSPESAAVCFFVLLTSTASARRSRGGPAGGLAPAFEEAGFSSSEWLPDRTDDLAVRLFAAPEEAPRGELLDVFGKLLRATLGAAPDGLAHELQLSPAAARSMLGRARERLPALLRWLEENGRELLETS